jgi:GNAT superfamily N-acetyltransferase
MSVGDSTPPFRHRHPLDPHDEIVVEAIETNLANYWLAIGENPKGEVHINDSVRWEYSGGPYFNRVVNADLDQADAEHKIKEIVNEFAARKAAITWLVGPSTSPHDLGERLAEHGFDQNEIWKGMARDLSTPLSAAPALPDGACLVEVRTDDERRDWMDVIAQSYGLPRGARELLYESVVAAEIAHPDSWTHNLVYQDEKPAAASTLFVSGGTAGIYLVATVPDARAKGLGSAVTWQALKQAQELGCSLAVLQSTEMAVGMYLKLGFETYCDISVYRLPAPSAMWKRLARVGARWLTRRSDSSGRRAAWQVKDETDPSQGSEPVTM